MHNKKQKVQTIHDQISASDKINFDWIPLKSVGPFKFNDSIKNYSQYEVIEIKEEYVAEVDWIVYGLSSFDFRIYVENELINSIGCFEKCIYKNINLIGISFMEFTQLLNDEPTEFSIEETDDGKFEIFDFDNFSAQVRVKNKIIESIIFSDVYSE